MSLSGHDRQELDVIEEQLAASDPQLAALLSAFSRLADGEAIPAREQIPASKQHGVGWAFRDLFQSRPTRSRPHGATRRYRRVLPVAVAVWLIISVALIMVAVLLSHTGGNGTCGFLPVTACVTHAPAHPQTGRQVGR